MERQSKRIQLPPGLAAALGHQAAPPQNVTVLAQPFNDAQLLSMVAAQLASGEPSLSAEAAVHQATDIVAEAVLAIQRNTIATKIDALRVRESAPGDPPV